MLSFIRANSNQESIATVDQFGHIRAIKEIVVTITAHIENTNLTAYFIVIVKVGAAEGNFIFVSALNLLRFSFFFMVRSIRFILYQTLDLSATRTCRPSSVSNAPEILLTRNLILYHLIGCLMQFSKHNKKPYRASDKARLLR